MASKKLDIPEPQLIEENLEDGKVVAALGYSVCSWRDGPANSDIPVSQVHVLVPLPIDGMRVALRFKSRRALDEFVGVLLDYRNQVWPESKS